MFKEYPPCLNKIEYCYHINRYKKRKCVYKENNMKEYFTIEESMKGKVAFMTGDTMGIGRATVTTFIQAGVNVVFVGRSEDKGKEIEAELNALGKGEATFMKCDVTDFDRLAQCVNAAYEK